MLQSHTLVKQDENAPANYQDINRDLLRKIVVDERVPVSDTTFEDDIKELSFIEKENDFKSEGETIRTHNIHSKLNHVSSDFSDADCGEAMLDQHLRIDFTPIPGIDDSDHVQRKCIEFWNFVDSQPRLMKLFVSPMKEAEEEVVDKSNNSTSSIDNTTSTEGIKWLKKIEGQPETFTVKNPMKYCNFKCGDYLDDVDHKKHKAKDESEKITSLQVPETEREKRSRWSPSTEQLCQDLAEWDRQHPRSKDPPGRDPNLTHAILQRKMQ